MHYIADKQMNPSGLVFTRQDGTSYEPQGHAESILEDMVEEDDLVDSTQPVEIAEEDDLVNSTQPAEIEEVNIKDDDEAIDDDVEVLLVPPIEELQTIDVEHDGLDGRMKT